MEEKQNVENENDRDEVTKLIRKVVGDFYKKIDKEKDLSVILLKGHLLIEHYLNYLIIVLHDTTERTDKKSFSEKIDILNNDGCLGSHVIASLRKLNDVRNNLSHELNYRLSESEVDRVGFNLGKKYIFRKFSIDCDNDDDLRSLFLFVIDDVLFSVFQPLFKEILKKRKEESENKKIEEQRKTNISQNSNATLELTTLTDSEKPE